MEAKVWHANQSLRVGSKQKAVNRAAENPTTKLSSSSVTGHIISHFTSPRTKVTYLGTRQEFSINVAVNMLLFHKLLRFRRNNPDTVCFCFMWRCGPTRAMASSLLRFLDHTQRRTTVGRTPLDEWSARCRDLYLTTHNTHNRQTSIPPVGFEPTISASVRPQTYALDRAATGTGNPDTVAVKNCTNLICSINYLILGTCQ